MLTFLLAACVSVSGPPTSPPPVVVTTPGTPTSGTPTATPAAEIPEPAVCERVDGYDGFGAPKMRLDATEYAVGEPLTLTAAGAVPGDVVTFEVGRICALDCPAELDGGCYQPVGALALGTATADAAGVAQLTVTAEAWTGDDYFVLQAVAWDAEQPYLSQALADQAGWQGHFDHFEVPPMTVRSLAHAVFRTTVPAGRRVEVTLGGDPVYSGLLYAHAESATSQVWYTNAGTTALDVDTATTFDLYAEYDDWGGWEFSVDFRVVPRTSPIAWAPDGDGDGFGDPGAAAVASTTPVAGHSADLRDCDDGDAALRPWGPEVCGDGLDQDCDGADRPCALDAQTVTFDAGESGTVIRGEASSFAGWNLALGDVDDDGRVELVVGGEHGYAVDVADRADREASAVHGFRTEQGTIELGDFDGDGVTDLLSGAYLLTGPLTLPVTEVGAEIPPSGGLYGAGDVDGDGDLEVMLGASTFPGSGHELWEPEGWTMVATLPAGVEEGFALADADGDGLDDLWTGELCVYLAPFPNDVPSGCVDDGPDDFVDYRRDPVTGDVDGDGHLDAAMGDGAVARILYGPIVGDRSIADATWSTFTSGRYQAEIALAGSRMLVVSAPVELFDPLGSVWIAPTGPGAHSDADAVRLVAGLYGDVVAGDGDGDGIDDLFVSWPERAWGGDPNVGLVTAFWGE